MAAAAGDAVLFEGPSARGILGDGLRASQEAPARGLDVSGHPAGVSRVTISGVSRIRRGFMDRLLGGVLAARTVEQAVAESWEAAERLQALGMAKNVEVLLDVAGEGREGIDVYLRGEDGGRYAIRTGVDVGDNEGSASVTARLGNIWGGGESLEASYMRGTKTAAAFHGLLAAPVGADPLRRIELGASQIAADARPYAAHDDVRRRATLAYHHHRHHHAAGPAGTTHEVRYVAEWRDICGLGADASPTLRSEAGHTLKSSVAYTVGYDDRDSRTVPTSGSLARATAEACGLLGGSVSFAKVDGEFQASQRLGASRLVVSAGVQGGVLWSFGARSPLADRFFLGGPTSVRGFEYRGIGPRDGGDSLGGDAFYAAGVSLLTPLPWVRTPALMGHVWANAGQLALLDGRGLLRAARTTHAGGPRAEIERFFMQPSVAVGVGLVYRHSLVRAELSCALPLAAAAGDRPKAGLQFGLGLRFL
ncbi:hypothetical protein H4R18_003000 [Coemansia javaensis]|uniref:Bacterial surface antigen (D15) domain-containing protein n=1 Tax=Coemansia javaensis TaxID=2761396 RepID=A0A9W8HGS1_9FUNG|nr:hypothetical protein H4R18_003000 [Coemansia javaensis]